MVRQLAAEPDERPISQRNPASRHYSSLLARHRQPPRVFSRNGLKAWIWLARALFQLRRNEPGHVSIAAELQL
jgi:hypothetical protein